MQFNFPTVRENLTLNEASLRNIQLVVNNIMNGKINARGEFTVTASQDTTTVTDPRVGGASVVLLSPMSANAALEWTSGSLYISSTDNGSFVVAHSNNSLTDRDFRYAVIG